MTKFSDSRQKKSLGGFNKKTHLINSLIINKIFISLIISLSALFVSAQTIDQDTPDLPPWINNVIYIDFEATGSLNLGTYEHPATAIPWNGLANNFGFWDERTLGWNNGQTTIVGANNYAILFKRDSEFVMGNEVWNGVINIIGDSLYVGSYGQGERPLLKMYSLKTRGRHNTINGIEVMSFDPYSPNAAIETFGKQAGWSDPVDVFISDVKVSRAGTGLWLHHNRRIYINNVHIERIGQNGLYAGNWWSSSPGFVTDSVFIHNTMIKDVNLNYFNMQHDDSGGDAAQIGALYTEYVNCYFDRSKTSFKQGLIHNWSNVEFINSVLITHPNNGTGLRGGQQENEMPTGHPYPEKYRGFNATNSVFIGGARTLYTWNKSRYVNNIFIGYGKDVSDTYQNQQWSSGNIIEPVQTWTLSVVSNTVEADFYNNTFVDIPTFVTSGQVPLHLQNNIFYNTGSLSSALRVYGGNNIFFNDDESNTSNLNRFFFPYNSNNNYFKGIGVESGGNYYTAIQNNGPSYGGARTLSTASFWQNHGSNMRLALEAMGNSFIDPKFIDPAAHTLKKVDYYPKRETFTRNHGASHFELYFRPGQNNSLNGGTSLSNITDGVSHSGTWFTVPNNVSSFSFTHTTRYHTDRPFSVVLIAENIGNGNWEIRYQKNHPYYVLENFDATNFSVQSISPAINSGNPNVYLPSEIYGRYGQVNSNNGFTTTETEYTFLLDVDPWHTFYPYAYKDFLGVPRGQGEGYDIGAFEYTGQTGHTLIFKIENESGNAINNARITFNAVLLPPGVYTLYDIEEGTYDFSVTAPDFETYFFTGLVVAEDMEIQVIMTQLPTYNVSFNVINVQSDPINNATISFGELFNPIGNYQFTGITPGTYNYSVMAPGHQAVNVNNFELTGNTTISVTMSPNNYQVNLNSNPTNGGTTSGGGTYFHGQSATISAASSNGYVFANWTENGNVVSNNASYTFNVTQNRNLTANFIANLFTITLNASPVNGGTTNGGGTLSHDQIATVIAIPEQGYVFINWTENGNVISTNPSYTFNVTQNRNLTANFNANLFTITLNASPVNGGTTNGGGTLSHGQMATVTAIPEQEYVFINWTENGNVVSSDASYTFTISQNRNLTANFELEMFDLIYLTDSNGEIIGNPEQEVSYGANGKPVHAAPHEGHHFVRWCDQSTFNPRTEIFVTQNITRTAIFAKNIYHLSYGIDKNGFVLGETAQFIEYGEDALPVEAIPLSGFEFIGWSDGNKANPRTDIGITSNLQVFAMFDYAMILEEPDHQNIKVYPIPTKNVLNIEIPFAEEFEVQLFDMQGRFIYTFPKAAQGSQSYNVSWLSPGIYFLNFVSTFERITKRIIIGR